MEATYLQHHVFSIPVLTVPMVSVYQMYAIARENPSKAPKARKQSTISKPTKNLCSCLADDLSRDREEALYKMIA